MNENTANKIGVGSIVQFNMDYYEAEAVDMTTTEAIMESVCQSIDDGSVMDEEKEAEAFILSVQTSGGLVVQRGGRDLNLVRAKNGRSCLLRDRELTLVLHDISAVGRSIAKGDTVVLNLNRDSEAEQWLLENWFGDPSMKKQANAMLEALLEDCPVVAIQVIDDERLAVVRTKAGEYPIHPSFLFATNVNWVEYASLMAC